MKHSTIIATLLVLLLSACAGTINTKEKPVLHDTILQGEHTQLASCVVKQLSADTRMFMRMFHYKSRVYPDLAATEIHAYDTRFLPYVYASNSPQNPDAIRDYVTPSPEVMTNTKSLVGAEYIYEFAFTLRQTDENKVAVLLKGNSYVGGIAWNYLLNCTTNTQ